MTSTNVVMQGLKKSSGFQRLQRELAGTCQSAFSWRKSVAITRLFVGKSLGTEALVMASKSEQDTALTVQFSFTAVSTFRRQL